MFIRFCALFFCFLGTSLVFAQGIPKRFSLVDTKLLYRLDKNLRYLDLRLQQQIKDHESYINYHKEFGEAQLAASRLILTLPKNEAEEERGYALQLKALKMLRRHEFLVREQSQPSYNTYKDEQQGEYHRQIETLLKTLEQSGKHPRLTNTEHISKFYHRMQQVSHVAMPSYPPPLLEKYKAEAKQWANTKPTNTSVFDPLNAVLRSVFMHETGAVAEEFIAFLNSDQCTLSKQERESTIKRLEAVRRRCAGSVLNLYGKTINDREFDWTSYRGRYVYLIFDYAEGPWLQGLPDLREIDADFRKHGFEIVFVGIREPDERFQQIMEREKISWTVISESLSIKAGMSAQSEYYAIDTVSTILLVDQQGKIIHTYASGSSLRDMLTTLLPKDEQAASD